MSEEPPRKSTDPTIAIDREKISEAAKAAIKRAQDAYPSLPPDYIVTDPPDEQPTTQVACPTCQRCPSCGGTHQVSSDKRSELLRKETGV